MHHEGSIKNLILTIKKLLFQSNSLNYFRTQYLIHGLLLIKNFYGGPTMGSRDIIECNPKQPSCKKVCGPQEGHCVKRCEIQGGGQEMA